MGSQRVGHDWATNTCPARGKSKLKWSHSVVSDSLWPHGLEPIRFLRPWNFQARVPEWVAISFSRESSWPKDRTRVSLQADTLPSEPPDKRRQCLPTPGAWPEPLGGALGRGSSETTPHSEKFLYALYLKFRKRMEVFVTVVVQPHSRVWLRPHGLQLARLPCPITNSRKWKWSRSVVFDSATPWTVAHQAPLSIGFSRQ